MPRGIDRRTALKSLGALAAGGLTSACGGGSSTRPLSETIDTVVVLMMENRSFDHYFGALSLEEGRTDVDGLTAGMSNPDTAGNPVLIHPADANCIADPPHGWNRCHAQFNDGKNDGFVREYADAQGEEGSHRVMGYLNRRILPVSYTLADEFAICQRWFASLMTSTWPNRHYSLAAQNNGIRTNDQGAVYDFATIYDLARSADRSYKIYYSNISFSFLYKRDYPRDRFVDVHEFYEDARAGTLPNLSIIEPIYGLTDDHPPAHPLAGQTMIAAIYDALARSPQWGRSLLVVNYDEHGGFFDHVPPPKAPDAHAADGFDQLGFRVPAIIAGPYVQRGLVSNTVRDHTSTLAFLRNLWGTRALTERDAAANDLSDLLDYSLIDQQRPRPPVAIPVINADESVIFAEECVQGIGLARGKIAATGQPELEAFFDQNPQLAWADRRSASEKMYQEHLRYAEKRGLLRLKSSGL